MLPADNFVVENKENSDENISPLLAGRARDIVYGVGLCGRHQGPSDHHPWCAGRRPQLPSWGLHECGDEL
jgi:hypothetical protein